MRYSWMMVAVVAMVGCKNVPAPDPFDPNVVADVPDWIEETLVGQDNACDDAYLWDEAVGSTAFFAGSYVIDGDSLIGNEFWIHYVNPNLAAEGYSDCQIVWDVIGTKGESVNVGSYSLTLTGVLDENESNCAPNAEGNTFAVGEEIWEETYDVIEAGGNVQILFAASGNTYGSGVIENGVLSWVSEHTCNFF